MCQDSRSIGALVRRRCHDSVCGPGFALLCPLLCQHLRSAGAPPSSPRRLRTEHDEDPLRLRQRLLSKESCVLSESFASFGLRAEGRSAAALRGPRIRLLHLGALHGVNDCWSEASEGWESVESGGAEESEEDIEGWESEVEGETNEG